MDGLLYAFGDGLLYVYTAADVLMNGHTDVLYIYIYVCICMYIYKYMYMHSQMDCYMRTLQLMC